MKKILEYLGVPLVVSGFLFGADLMGYIVTVIFCFPIILIGKKCFDC